MSKTTKTYWNALSKEHASSWTPVKGAEDLAEELTLSIDEETGEYTRLTRFFAGADTSRVGAKSHDYPEEIFVVSGRIYDEAFDMWLETGHYASRPPGELHGPFTTEHGCIVLEVSFPNRAVTALPKDTTSKAPEPVDEVLDHANLARGRLER